MGAWGCAQLSCDPNPKNPLGIWDGGLSFRYPEVFPEVFPGLGAGAGTGMGIIGNCDPKSQWDFGNGAGFGVAAAQQGQEWGSGELGE